MHLCVVSATAAFFTLSLHDALPISVDYLSWTRIWLREEGFPYGPSKGAPNLVFGSTAASYKKGYVEHILNDLSWKMCRSEEHTSELQSRGHLVCRLLLEKKKHNINK